MKSALYKSVRRGPGHLILCFIDNVLLETTKPRVPNGKIEVINLKVYGQHHSLAWNQDNVFEGATC
jgi:hypothetical protein